MNLGRIAVVPKGEYNPELEYKKLDLVSYIGSSYYAKKNVPSGKTPSANLDFWQVASLRGERGDNANPITGTATQSNAPTPYDAVTYPDGLYESYKVVEPITSPNNWGNLTVTQTELDENTVFFNVENGVVTKFISAKIADINNITNITNENTYNLDPSQIVPSEALYNDPTETLAGDILKRVDKFTGEDVNYREVTKWHDGSAMDDSKVDGIFYKKIDSKYYRAVFRTLTPKMCGAIGDGIADDTIALQRFFDFLHKIPVEIGDVTGIYKISNGITFGVQGVSSKSLYIIGNMRIICDVKIDTALSFINLPYLVHKGNISVRGTGSTGYSSRTCRRGIRISACARASFDNIKLDNFYGAGMHIEESAGNTTGLSFNKVRASACGSGQTSGFLSANWSNRTDTGTTGSGGQRTTITVDVMPPQDIFSIKNYPLIYINGNQHLIYSADYTNNTLTVGGWIDLTLSTGSLRYVFGGGIVIQGSDAGVIGFDFIDAVNCMCAIDMMSLYGPRIGRLIAQSCYTSAFVGLRTDSATVTYYIGNLYVEGNVFDFCQLTNAASDGGYFIAAEYAFDLTKYRTGVTIRASDNSGGDSYQLHPTTAILKNGTLLRNYKKEKNRTEAGSVISVSVNSSLNVSTYRTNSKTIKLSKSTILNNSTGLDSTVLIIQGLTANNVPTGSITFTVADETDSINGVMGNAVFSNFKKTPVFSIYYSYSNSSFMVVNTTDVVSAQNSPNTAPNVGTNYSQAEVQAILTELRDLKSKMQAAGLML